MKNVYLTYTVEELAQETDFIQWVKQTDSTVSPSWKKWLEDHPEQVSKVDDARQLIEAITSPRPELSRQQKDRLWANIDKNTSQQAVEISLQSRRIWLKRISVAAAIALLIGAGLWWTNTAALAFDTQIAQTSEHELPDGSTINLNAVSAISYNPQKWKEQRQIDLDGEAFFEVEKGSPFKVITSAGTVEVLGTSFNVESRGGSLKVICYTGSVRVSNLAGESVILKPNESAQIENEQLTTQKIVGEKDIAWQQKMHHFENTAIGTVFDELERQFDVKVNCPQAIRARIYNGFFKSGDAEKALQAICWPMQLDFTIDAQQITISE